MKRILHSGNRKRAGCIVWLLAALIIVQLPVTEADAATSASDFHMEGSTLTKYRGTDTRVTVPDDVRVVGESAFEGNTNIELVVIPDSVERIEAYAFWGCDNLDTVVLGRGLKEVGDFAFADCTGLEQMTIPSNITSIGIQAFANCTKMTDITIPPEVTSIDETAFDGCYQLTIHCEAGSAADVFAQDFYERQKQMPGYGEPSADVSQDQQTNPVLQDGQSVGDGSAEAVSEAEDSQASVDASQSTSGTGNLLGSTKVVGNRAVVFMDNTAPSVFEGGQSGGHAGGSGQANAETGTAPGQTAGAEGSAQQMGMSVGLPKYTIVDGTVVADQAYYRNAALGSIVLPQGIQEIGQFSFARSSLEQITIPVGIKSIGYGAFYHCGNLSQVQLPDTIEKVEPKAFEHTAWVENFKESGSEDFLISGGVLVAYAGNAAQVAVPEGVRVIAGEAFRGHTEIQSVTFPNSLISIGEGAFEGCTGLAEAVFGDAAIITHIRDRAFAGCPLTSVQMPATVVGIGLGAFDDGTEIVYEGDSLPESTYEISAQRLSNEAYRRYGAEAGQPGVTVSGLEGAAAQLAEAARAYTLSIAEAADSGIFGKGYTRSFGTELPENSVIYELELRDSSNIPITELGGRALTLTLPVPESLKQDQISVYVTDRNGQIEELAAERITTENTESLRFSTDYVSYVGLCSAGETISDSEILEETNSMTAMSALRSDGGSSTALGLVLIGAAFVITGTIILILRTKKEQP